jgi:hypothetical protein
MGYNGHRIGNRWTGMGEGMGMGYDRGWDDSGVSGPYNQQQYTMICMRMTLPTLSFRTS